jgi:uncharacterized Zn finger protein (UPF0148 family)
MTDHTEHTTIEDDMRCDKCGAPLTTAMMAVFCPAREKCEFWPEDEQGQQFILMLRGEDFSPDEREEG